MSDVALVINLQKRNDRWKFMQRVAERINVQVERVEAVDGHSVDLASVSLDPLVLTTLQTGRKFSTVHIESRGALGCMMSHRKAWARVVELGVPTLVLEDDADPSERASDWVKQARQQVAAGTWDIVLLGTHGQSPPGVGLRELPSWFKTGVVYTGSWAVLVSPQAAARLLEASRVLTFQSDAFLHTVGLRVGFVSAFKQAMFFRNPDIKHIALEPVDKTGFVVAFVLGVLSCAGVLAFFKWSRHHK